MDKRWQAYLLSVIGGALIEIGNALAQAAATLQAEAQGDQNPGVFPPGQYPSSGS